MPRNPNREYLAVDTETTGLELYRGCQPFAVSACDGTGQRYYWEAPVDPFTRVPYWTEIDLNSIRHTLSRYPYLVFHNACFDLKALDLIGCSPLTRKTHPIEHLHDTLLMSHGLDSQESHGLKSLALKYLEFPDEDEQELGDCVKRLRHTAKRLKWLIGESWGWDYWLPRAISDAVSKTLASTSIDRNTYNEHQCLLLDSFAGQHLGFRDICKRYAMNDAVRTIRLFFLFQQELQDKAYVNEHRLPWQVYLRERDLIPVTYQMMASGIAVSKPTLDAEIKRFKCARTKAVNVFRKAAGTPDLNLNSPQQLIPVLNRLIPTGFLTESSNKDTLIAIWRDALGNYCDEDGNDREFRREKKPRKADIAIDALLRFRVANSAVKYDEQYRELAVFHSPDDEIANAYYALHPSANQTGTGTTRYSMSNPNGQNVSARAEMPLRKSFVPKPGCFWYDIDYANLELRVLAHLSQEPSLVACYAKGENAMLLIASELWQEEIKKTDRRYKRTKNAVYAYCYGAGDARFDSTIGFPGGAARFGSRFPRIKEWGEETIREARQTGFIQTLFGYRLKVPRDRPYAAIDYRIQGTAGDLIKEAMLNIHRGVKLGAGELCYLDAKIILQVHDAKIILQVHDELVIEVSNRYRKSKPLLEWIICCMEEPGQRVGVCTPVEVNVVESDSNWANGQPLEIGG